MSDAAASSDTSQRSDNAGSASTSLLDRLRQRLGNNGLVVLLFAGAASLALVIALFMWASSPEYRVLYSNLSEADGGSIITELDSRGVPYRFSNNGQAILVPADQVHPLRLQLAEQGLPAGGSVGLELMDSQAFGISQFAEQVNYQRGLEGELAQSVQSLGGVEEARVHLSLARPSVFIRDREPAKASVVLTMQPGRVLGDGQVSAVVHMVASSVPELAAGDVSVVNQDGQLLSADRGSSGDLDGSQLSYINEVERSYRQRIENILTPILGSNNVRAQVAAQIDFSRREETRERFAPNQGDNPATVRSRQYRRQMDGNDLLANGIPGALTNAPPGTAASPINAPAEDEDEDADQDNPADGEDPIALSTLDQNNVINYEVDRNIEHIQYRQGEIERLTAAVVINFREQLNEDGEPEPVALPDEQIAQIEGLVRQAMGFSAARGDEIEVVNTPFTRREQDTDTPEWWQRPEVLELAASAGRYLMVLLAALLLYLLILRPLIKRYTQTSVPAQRPLEAGTDRQDEPAEAESEAEDSDDTYQRPKRKRKTSLYENNLNDLREMAQEDPRMVAMIIRSWMKSS